MRALLMAAALAGCVANPTTGEDEVNWRAVQQEISLLTQDGGTLDNLAQVVETQDPVAAVEVHKLRGFVAVLEVAVARIADGEPNAEHDAIVALEAVSDVLDELADLFPDDPDAQLTLRLGVFGVREVVNRMRAYIPEPAEDLGT